MPTLTNYWFEDTDFRGNTAFLNITHGNGIWAWINWANIGSTDSTLVWEREDREIVVDLVPVLNTPDIQDAVDNILGGSAQRTSDIRAGWIPWRYVPYRQQDPARHADLDLLVRIFFNFHIDTPWFCTDADGNISYYLVPFLDGSGRLGAYVDGWTYDYDGGNPFCTGTISDSLDQGVANGLSTVQSLIDRRLELFANRRFDLLYLLPGNGTRSGDGSVNVNEHVSLALLPRPQ